MNAKLTSAVLAAALVLPAAAHACLWDKDTLRDELDLSGVEFYELLTGSFPHHGEFYYQARIEAMGSDLGGMDLDALNDLAVAHIRSGDIPEGRRILAVAHGRDQEHYPTLSNLGVAAKKAGDFETAAEWLRKALAINPEGHMGLGDWYLRLVEWRADYDVPGAAVPAENFLGESYDDQRGLHLGIGQEDPDALERCRLLLTNDQSSAEAFLYVGDFLTRSGDLHLAAVAYARALQMDHPAEDVIAGRLDNIHSHWDEASLSSADQTSPAASAEAIEEGAAWLAAFKAAEAELIAAGTPEPTFEEVRTSLGEQQSLVSPAATASKPPSIFNRAWRTISGQ